MIIGNTRDETRAFHGNDPDILALSWNERLLRALHVECKLADDPRGGERRLFAQVPYIQRGTY